MCFFSEKFYIEMERTLEQFGDRIIVISGVIGDKINIVADKVKNLSVSAVNQLATYSPKITTDKAVQTELLTKINNLELNTDTNTDTIDTIEPNKQQNEIRITITEEDESSVHWPKTNHSDWFLDESWDIMNDS